MRMFDGRSSRTTNQTKHIYHISFEISSALPDSREYAECADHKSEKERGRMREVTSTRIAAERIQEDDTEPWEYQRKSVKPARRGSHFHAVPHQSSLVAHGGAEKGGARSENDFVVSDPPHYNPRIPYNFCCWQSPYTIPDSIPSRDCGAKAIYPWPHPEDPVGLRDCVKPRPKDVDDYP
jgi:hypothetical protein